MITIVYGPMGCGKTRNVEALKSKHPHANLFDSWYGEELLDDTLVLTHLEPPFRNPRTNRRLKLKHDLRVLSFAEAMGGA